MKIETTEDFIKWIEFNGYRKDPEHSTWWIRFSERVIIVDGKIFEIELNILSKYTKIAYPIMLHTDLVNEIIPFMRRNIPNLKDLPNA